jgi:hypothetical protein
MKKYCAFGLFIYGCYRLAFLQGLIPRGVDTYRIEFTGKQGEELIGTTAWKDRQKINSLLHIDSVKATLPHTVNLSVVSGAFVTANGGTLGQGKLTVKIYRNGIECGLPTYEGVDAMASKSCKS